MSIDEPADHEIRVVKKTGEVPVFDCHVYLSPPSEQGIITGRASLLANLSAEGRSEREVLRNLVANFKDVIGGCLARGEPIPWLPQPTPAKPGETQRFVPVHF